MKKLSREEVKKEIEENRNHSWIKEIYERHKFELDRVIIDYFGNEITYITFLNESFKLAKAMKASGLKKGDEFVVFIDRIPESVYLLGAASIIGANINLVSEKFNKEYLKTIINNAGSKLIFVQDNKLSKLSSLIEEIGEHDIITISHKRSLPRNNKYEKVLSRFYDNTSQNLGRYTDYDDFVASGKDYTGKVYEESTLDDAFTTTYSSGTTKRGMPKGIVHINRHYITMGRYHDPIVSGLPSLKNYSTYSNIPSYSNSYLLSALSDNLILGGKVILDPIDNPEYFLIGSKIHKANVNIATTTTWLVSILAYYDKNRYIIEKLPDALFNFVAGEQLSAGEEKFINKFFKDAKCGINITHTPFSLAKASTAGADCEHGSVFIKLFRAYFNELPYRKGRSEPVGMTPYDFVDIRILRKDGTYCEPLEHGRIVANSDCNMKEYSHDPEETKEFYIKDAYGNVWGDMKNWGFVDEKGNISMKGRYNENDIIPCYRIADEILKDTKKIMSCEVVCLETPAGYVYVAHIMPQYGASFDAEAVLNGAMQRCISKFGNGIENILYFRIHDLKEKYPVSDSVKRDIVALKDEGLNNIYDFKYKKQTQKRRIKTIK